MKFGDKTLADLASVGATGREDVRLWIRSSTAGLHELQLVPEHGSAFAARFALAPDAARDGATSIRFPEDFDAAPKLSAGTRYTFRIVRCADDSLLGAGKFETAPLTPAAARECFSIAFTSCHQPFAENGAVKPGALDLLDVLDEALDSQAVTRLVLTGDQIYADTPKRYSLFHERYFRSVAPAGRRRVADCTRQEVRRLYQQRYRIFWGFPAFQRLLANRATYMSLDDHEVVDNFGSAPEHASSEFEAVREGALDAYWDYQGLRVAGPGAERPPSFHFDFEYGPVAIFVVDVRSERRCEGRRLRIYSDAQHAELERFLARHAHRDALGIVTGVPIVHIPDWLNAPFVRFDRGRTDLSDRWSVPGAHACRRRLLGALFEHQQRHPRQRLVLVAGDIHTGSAFELRWEGTPHRLWQLNASALSNVSTTPLQWAMQKAPWLTRRIRIGPPYPDLRVSLLPDEQGHGHNPYGGLNVGLMQLTKRGGETALGLKLITHAGRASGYRTLYSSADL
jgi:alkaline phosphatase D